MKNSVIFILSFFVCSSVFAQDMIEKRYFENHPDIGGDVQIKSSSIKVEKDEIFKTFEIESPEEGVYYMDAWIEAPLTKEGYPEYKVAVNGVLSEFTFKPQGDGWHSLPLTDMKKSVAAIPLKKGKNSISVIGEKPIVPDIEFIKLSSNISKTGISDTNYKKLLESIKSNTLRAANNTDAMRAGAGSLLTTTGTNDEIYDYYLNIHANYTTCHILSFSAGENINITAVTVSGPFVIELFNISEPESYSWSANSTTGFSVNFNVTIPATGTYFLLCRFLNNNIGVLALNINGNIYNNSFVTYSPQYVVTGGYPTPANFFTCKIKEDGDPLLLLADNSGCIKAFNDDGGTTLDGYSWGKASRITTNLTNINYGLVFSFSIYSFALECDLYMGLLPTEESRRWPSYSSTVSPLFPNLPGDNSYLSGRDANYNCIAWSVGDTLNVYDYYMYYTMEDWDDWYGEYGYTRIGATEANAAIALWGHKFINSDNDTVIGIRHASVRKNSVIPKPHGFEWESKLGARWDRAMHTRDALEGNEYGSIQHYYRPISGTVNYSLPASSRILQSSFSASELNRIATLKNNLPAAVLSDFNTKYLIWEKTWDRPEIAIHSDPFMYARSSEYESLREYCMKYGKAIWPLLFDKLVQRDIFVISLLRDLTYTGKGNFGAEITRSAPVKNPTLYTMQVDYCKGLLAKEEANMLKSILDISTSKEESFEVSITVANSREMQLNLYSEKDEKALVRIYNFSGRLEFEASYNLSKGNQTLVINTSNFKKDVYVVQITIGGESISKTISI